MQKHRQEAAKLRQERFVERRRKLRAERQAAQAEARAKFDERKRNRQASASQAQLRDLNACYASQNGYQPSQQGSVFIGPTNNSLQFLCRHWRMRKELGGGRHSRASTGIIGSRGVRHS